MKIYEDSINTKLYLWFYSTNEWDLPKNLCPYFWKLVIMYILIVPYSIFCLPIVLSDIYESVAKNNRSTINTMDRVYLSIVLYLVLFLIVSLLSTFIIPWTDPNSFLGKAGRGAIIAWIVIIGIASYEGIKYLRRRSRISEKKEKSPNIIVEFTKAKYYKYCPTIEWAKKQK